MPCPPPASAAATSSGPPLPLPCPSAPNFRRARAPGDALGIAVIGRGGQGSGLPGVAANHRPVAPVQIDEKRQAIRLGKHVKKHKISEWTIHAWQPRSGKLEPADVNRLCESNHDACAPSIIGAEQWTT